MIGCDYLPLIALLYAVGGETKSGFVAFPRQTSRLGVWLRRRLMDVAAPVRDDLYSFPALQHAYDHAR